MAGNQGGCFIAGPAAQSTRREETRRGRDGKPEGRAGGTLQDPRTGGRPSETGPGADHQGPGASPDTGRSTTSRPQLPRGRWVRGRCGRATGSIVLLLVGACAEVREISERSKLDEYDVAPSLRPLAAFSRWPDSLTSPTSQERSQNIADIRGRTTMSSAWLPTPQRHRWIRKCLKWKAERSSVLDLKFA